jgi:hypothetical protein
LADKSAFRRAVPVNAEALLAETAEAKEAAEIEAELVGDVLPGEPPDLVRRRGR